MSDPLRASVVIPTHKRIPMLKEAIESALAQTERRIEVLVTIDGDDPETFAFVESIADPRVRALWDGRQRGEAGNTTRGIDAAAAPFFGILHDDDVWEPTLLERLLPQLEEHPDATVAFGDHWVIDAQGAVDHHLSEVNSREYGRAGLRAGLHQPFMREALVGRTLPAVMTSVYRRSTIDLADMPALPANFDYWLGWAAVRNGRAVVYVPERLSRYRVHGGSGTARARRAWGEASAIIYGELLQRPELEELHPVFRRRLSDAHRHVAQMRRDAGEPGAYAMGVKAIRERPSLKAVVAWLLLLVPRRSRAA